MSHDSDEAGNEETAAPTGAKIREIRRSKGLSQETLAWRAGIEQSTLSKIERGALRPADATVRRIWAVLQHTPPAN